MKASTVTTSDIYGNQYEVPVHDLTWRPAAYAIVVHNKKLLLVKERDMYHLPGGGVDLGESPEDGVIREVFEETNVLVASPRLAGSLTTFFAGTNIAGVADLSHVQSLLLYYLCTYKSGELSLDNLTADEQTYGLEPEWVDVSKLDTISIGSTIDWRPTVQKALHI